MTAPQVPQACPGHSLVELLTALTVGLIITLSVLQGWALLGQAQRTAESVRDLRESAAFAFAALEYDIRHAGLMGLANANFSANHRLSTAGADPMSMADCADYWQHLAGLPAFAVDTAQTTPCGTYRGTVTPGADMLSLSHSVPYVTADSGASALYVHSSREGRLEILTAAEAAARTAAGNQRISPVRVLTYYVSPHSSLSSSSRPVPSLRAREAADADSALLSVDTEIAAGVEDLQIELGIDADHSGAPGFGAVDRFVNPHEVSPGHRIIAIRVSLLIRSLDRDPWLQDLAALNYANRRFQPRRDGYRRQLFQRTFAMRNALQ